MSNALDKQTRVLHPLSETASGGDLHLGLIPCYTLLRQFGARILARAAEETSATSQTRLHLSPLNRA